MKGRVGIAGMAVAVLLSTGLTAQRATLAGSLPTVDAVAALKSVVPDLDRRLARFKSIRMPYNTAGLSDRERQMVDQLAIACRYLESIYWRQSDPEGLALYKSLAGMDTPLARNLRRYLVINGSRWDLVDENRPFVGIKPMPPGHGLYPPTSLAPMSRATSGPIQTGRRRSTIRTRWCAGREPIWSAARTTSSSSRSSTPL